MNEEDSLVAIPDDLLSDESDFVGKLLQLPLFM